jgi:hypothetical protein
MEERKGSIYKKPLIDLHNIFQRKQGEKNFRGSYPLSIDVKGGEKEQKHERKFRSMKTWGVA